MIQIIYIKQVNGGLEYAYYDFTKSIPSKHVKFISNEFK